MTDAERKLWRALRSRSVGPKFRRQVPLGPYVVDFVCFERRTIVEVDGGQHATNSRDLVRDAYFVSRGYQVRRFWNHDVLQNMEGVLISLFSENVSPGVQHKGVPHCTLSRGNSPQPPVSRNDR